VRQRLPLTRSACAKSHLAAGLLTFVLVLTLIPRPSRGQPDPWILVRDFDTRIETAGVSVLPPRGLGWLMSRRENGPNRYIIFGKRSADVAQRGHSIIAIVHSEVTDNLSSSGPATLPLLEAMARRLIDSSGPPGAVRIRDFSGSASDIGGSICFRYRALTHEYEDPPPAGKRFFALTAGLTCLHPDVPRFIALTVGQRIPSESQPIQIEWEVRPFLEKPAFRPLALSAHPPARIPPGVREWAVRMVFEHAQAHASQWAAISSIAEKIGRAAETLRSGVRQAERDAGRRAGLTTDERARLK